MCGLWQCDIINAYFAEEKGVLMDEKMLGLQKKFEEIYGAFEQELAENMKEREDPIFSGNLYGVEIALKIGAGNYDLTVSSGDNAFWGKMCDIEQQVSVPEDIGTLGAEEMESQWVPTLRAYIEKCIEEAPFGGIYQPKVEVKLLATNEAWEKGLECKFNVEVAQKREKAAAQYRDFWLKDVYLECNIRMCGASMEAAYAFLFEDLFEEFGLEKVKDWADKMLARHNAEIAEAGEGCGQQKARRTKMIKVMQQYAFARGFLHVERQSTEGCLVPTADELDLICYMAVAIMRYGDYLRSCGLTLLQELAKGGHALAKQYIEVGTGAVAAQDAIWKNELAECSCNDVFETVTFKIKDENEETYQYLLEYLLNLMDTEFPKQYQIKLNSKLKDYLPVKSLKKTATHKFWVNCGAYKGLWPQMEAYVRKMMGNTKTYSDGGEDSEVQVATGGYAVLTLALEAPAFAGLFGEFLQTNENYDHNVLPSDAVEAYLAKWGVTTENLDAVLQCVAWYGELNPKKVDFSGLKNADVLAEVNRRELRDYILKRIVEYVWKNKKGLEKETKEATGAQKEQMQKLLDSVS